MICDLCNKTLEPLDANMKRHKGKLTTAHIKCWKVLEREVERQEKANKKEK